ncbi:MAG: helix-turn-helix domain-containing protein [Caldilineaceae bacterium]
MQNNEPMIPLSINLEGDSEDRAERRDAVENRQRVLAAAKALFAEHGVANVHMAQIAEAAGVGKGTLYRRFANKADLCQALMHDQLSEHQEAILARLHGMQEAKAPYLERLKVFFEEVVVFTERHVPLLCEVQRGGQIGGSTAARPFSVAAHDRERSAHAAVRAGELPSDTDVPMRVDLLLAPLTASYFRYLRRRHSLEAIREALREGVGMMG